MDYDSFEDQRIKHLEMIQSVIGRLGNNSFLVKGWSVTVAGVFLGLAVNSSSQELAAASFVPTILFWSLDSYYLWAERLFRTLYECVSRQSAQVQPFFMAATSKTFRDDIASNCSDERVSRQWRVLFSRTLLQFYGAVCLATAVVLMTV